VIKLLVWLIALPVALLGLALTIVVGVLSLVVSVLGSILAPLLGAGWTVLSFVAVVLLVAWLLVKLFESARAPAIGR
jgi:hypothetical protein